MSRPSGAPTCPVVPVGASRPPEPGRTRVDAPVDPVAPGGGPVDDPFALVDGRYRIVGELGSGAMGVVYRVEDVMLCRPAALKMIDPEVARSPAAVTYFLREARALARVRHENVVQVYAFGRHAETYFLAMELVDGETLEDLLFAELERGLLPPMPRVLAILEGIAAGLTAVHQRGLVHRDVKPGNVMLERGTGRPVMVDFGIVKAVGDPLAAVVGGTPSYMAPEQILDDADATCAQTDVYALACTAFEMLTGRIVFPAETNEEVMLQHVAEVPPRISDVRPDLAALDGVFARALAKAPIARHGSCVELVAEIGRALRGSLVQSAVRRRATAVDAASPTRILVLAGEEGLRRTLVREAMLALDRRGGPAAVDWVGSPEALLEALADRGAAVIVLDDDRVPGGALALVAELRAAAVGVAPRIVVVAREAERPGGWAAAGARRVPKPLLPPLLAAALDEALASEPESLALAR